MRIKTVPSYVPALDGIRGWSTLIIIFHHVELRGIPMPLRGGNGFDMFMVISGFLVTRTLLRELDSTGGGISISRFWVRRELNLHLPLLICSLLTVGAAWLWGGGGLEQALMAALWNSAYLTNLALITGAQNMKYFENLWALSLQTQFYLLWPILLLSCVRLAKVRGVFFLALCLSLASWMWRIILVMEGTGFHRIYYSLDAHMDSLAWGCAVAALLHWRGIGMVATKKFAVFSCLAAAGVFTSFVFPFTSHAQYFVLGGVAMTLLVAVVIADVVHNQHSKVRVLLEWEPLASLGRISYSVVLCHNVIIHLLRDNRFADLDVQMLTVVLSVLFGWALFCFVELPCQRLKKRLT